MTHIHYKFSSKLNYNTVVFDGPHITLNDLKKQIMTREKLRAADCDLQITNAQSKDEYKDNEDLIPKGSSVIVRRIPMMGGRTNTTSKTHNIERLEVHGHSAFGASRAMDDRSSSKTLSLFNKIQSANLVDADVSEEEKIRVIANQTSYDPFNLNAKFGNVLPENYTCYRCGNTGHHIRNCPTVIHDKNFEGIPKIKKSTGIPRSFMVEVTDPSIKGVMLTNCGRYAIPAIDAAAYAVGKKERPPFIPREKSKSDEEGDPVPDELLCLICRDLLNDAVVIPCCGNSYCDECIRTSLLDSEDHECPTCNQSDVSPDTLIANKFLRQAVNNFKKEQVYAKTQRKNAVTPQSRNANPSTVSTPSPPEVQSQPKPVQSLSNQTHPKALNTQPSSQTADVSPLGVNATLTDSTSLLSEPKHVVTSDNEVDEKTTNDLTSGDNTLMDSTKSTAPSSTLVNDAPESVSGTQRPSPDLSQRLSGSPGLWGGSPSSLGYTPGGLTDLQLSNSSVSPSSSYSYSAIPSTVFPRFHTLIPTHQPHNSHPSAYLPNTPHWMLHTPQGAPIPALNSTPSSCVPDFVSRDWYRYQRQNMERSPLRHSSSHLKSSKSSHSYSQSSSHSGSRSRSRSRTRSPHSSKRHFHNHSHGNNPSYNYGYKRPHSTTPSSSSPAGVDYRSRSKSSSDHRKSRHHSKRSSSKNKSSKRSRKHSGKQQEGSSSHLHDANASNFELAKQNYLKWEQKYREWYEKYFSSYGAQFRQLDLPPPPHPPHPENFFYYNLQDNCSAATKHSSPSSDWSSYSWSSPTSSGSFTTPSHHTTDTGSPHKANDGHFPPSHSPTDDLPVCDPTKEEKPQQEQKPDGEQETPKFAGDLITVKHKKKSLNKLVKLKSVISSSDSTDDSEKTKKKGLKKGPAVCPKKTGSVFTGVIQFPPKQNKISSKHTDKQTKESKTSDKKQGCSKSCKKDVAKKLKSKISIKSEKLEKEKESGKTHLTKTEKNKKRKVEDEVCAPEKNKTKSTTTGKVESVRCTKIKSAVKPQNIESKSLQHFDEKEEKEESTASQPETNIWEGGIKVIPQKKISINITLDGKKKETTNEQDTTILEVDAKENPPGIREEKLNKTKTEVKESCQKNLSGEQIKPDESEGKETWNKAAFENLKEPKKVKQDQECEKKESKKNNLDSRQCAVTTREKEKSEELKEKQKKEDVKGQEKLVSTPCIQEVRSSSEKGHALKNEETVKIMSNEHRSKNKKWHEGCDTPVEKNSINSMTHTGGAGDMVVMETAKASNEARKKRCLVRLPSSKWDNDDVHDRKEIRADGDNAGPFVPLVTETSLESVDGNEQQRQRSVEGERDEERTKERNKKKNFSCSRSLSDRAPSRGDNKAESTMCTDGTMETRGESQSNRDGREESKRLKADKKSKHVGREEERKRNWVQSKINSDLNGNFHSSSPLSLSPHDAQRGSKNSFHHDQRSSRGSKEISRSSTLIDRNSSRFYKDVPEGVTNKDHHHSNPQSRSDRSARNHGYTPSLFSNDLVQYESSEGVQRGFPERELMRSRNRVEQGNWRPERFGRAERRNPDMVVRQAGDRGSRRDVKEDGMDEKRRPSSGSSAGSSASYENRRDNKRETRDVNKKEKRQASAELHDEEKKRQRRSNSSRRTV